MKLTDPLQTNPPPMPQERSSSTNSASFAGNDELSGHRSASLENQPHFFDYLPEEKQARSSMSGFHKGHHLSLAIDARVRSTPCNTSPVRESWEMKYTSTTESQSSIYDPFDPNDYLFDDVIDIRPLPSSVGAPSSTLEYEGGDNPSGAGDRSDAYNSAFTSDASTLTSNGASSSRVPFIRPPIARGPSLSRVRFTETIRSDPNQHPSLNRPLCQ